MNYFRCESEKNELRDDGQGQVVAVAAGVADLESVAPDGEERAVGKVAESTGDRQGRGVADQGEAPSGWQPTVADGAKGN